MRCDKDNECKIVRGRDLKELELWRLCKPDLTHNGFVWRKESENVDPLPFNPKDECEEGGLYFTTLDHIFEHFGTFGAAGEHWLGRIQLDDDEPVWQERKKWKAHRVVWHSVVKIGDMLQQPALYRKQVLQLLSDFGILLHWVPEELRDLELCTVAVQSCWQAIDVVPMSIHSVDLFAAMLQSQSPFNVAKVPAKFLSKQLFLKILKKKGPHFVRLAQVPENLRDFELCQAFVTVNAGALEAVPQQAKRDNNWSLCDVATRKDPETLRFCPTEYIVRRLRRNGMLLRFVPPHQRTDEMIRTSVRQKPAAINYVKKELRSQFVINRRRR